MTDTKGYTYFAIKTENEKIGLDEFNSYLTIKPTEFKKMFENGKTPKCTTWELSSGKLINPYYFEEIEKLINELEKHRNELIGLKKQNPEFSFVLEVVIFLGDKTPGLHFSERTIRFINDIGGTIDCDIYNEK
ncbi:DUF4279 domain-containing protein [uncultured Lacinutrix sp.]|uniref:DUF4279 domain-containing protein n=1 Tax=uncultured Lacinutrix sp. TaxID=574032 RepID=UPI0026147E79|nr:DUF4279 domain-containing protein [uncultured Lacinutrix sp.]